MLSMALHTLINSSTALSVTGIINVWQMEEILAVEAIAVALIAWHLAKNYKKSIGINTGIKATT